MSLAAGLFIARRYELCSRLGEGAAGAVWSAKHTLTHKRVALKFLKGPADHDVARRFIREARAASAVRHGNIVAIHDILTLDDGQLVLVMDLLEGESLARRLERSGTLSPAELSEVMAPLVSAVAAVHAAGIVHRDLKPENIFLVRGADARTQPMLLDFGVCKLTGTQASLLTTAGRVMGTPCYMAPEQALGVKDVDAGADVWALGVIFYECLAGRRPLDADNWFKLMRLIASGRITPLAELAPQLPAELSSLVEQMLTRERDARLSDLGLVLDLLRRLGERTETGFSWQAPRSPAQRGARTMLLGALIALASLSVAGGSRLLRERDATGATERARVVNAAPPTDDAPPLAPALASSASASVGDSVPPVDSGTASELVQPKRSPATDAKSRRRLPAKPPLAPHRVAIEDFGGRR